MADISGYALAAIVGVFSTYLFVTLIEERKVRHARHLAAEAQAMDLIKLWRQAFLREWFDRRGGGRGSGTLGPHDGLKDLLAQVLDCTLKMPVWKVTLVRKALLVMGGEDVIYADWLGPVNDDFREGPSANWLTMAVELDNHFSPELAESYRVTADRLESFSHESWTQVLIESHFLMRAVTARLWLRPFLQVRMSKTERKALRDFGYLPSMRRGFKPASIRPAIRLSPKDVIRPE